MQTDNKESNQHVVTRLSKMQKAIVAYLKTTPKPRVYASSSLWIGDLPKTGDIITALGKKRMPATYSSVSRALRRLEERGIVSRYDGKYYSQGKALRYSLNEPHT